MKLVSSTVMATQATTTQSSQFPTLCLLAGWLVPGAGHLLLRKPIRAALLFVSVVAMFTIGLSLQGKIYQPASGGLLDILGSVGQLGTGLLYLAARLFDWGTPTVQIALADYGTKFIVVAGLLNVISAIDAQLLASGRKES